MIVEVGNTYVDTSSGRMFKVNAIKVRQDEKGRAETVATVMTASFDSAPAAQELVLDTKLVKNLQLINM